MIRGGQYDEKFDRAFGTGHAILGWGRISDISHATDRSEIYKILAQAYPDDSGRTWSNWTGQLWSFLHEILRDDLICMPHKKNRTFIVGRWTGEGYRHRLDFPVGCQHTAPVDWLCEFRMAEVSNELKKQLGRQGTVIKIKHETLQAEVKDLLSLPISKVRPAWITEAPEGVLEGERRTREQAFLSRDYRVVAEAWSANLSRYRVGTCEICKFEADDRGMFDVHHLDPIAQGRRITKVSDLLVLCPRCHRRAHRKPGPIPYSLEELRAWNLVAD
jgi:predicted Mrr-cat superfamily restriction endonuclease